MGEIAPEAYCDALLILNGSPKSLLPMSVTEMHLFSYLGCILALFQGEPIGDWGYSYAVTEQGFPFSAEFEEARKVLHSHGLLEMDGNNLQQAMQPALNNELTIMLGIGSCQKRSLWIKAAMQCALTFPLALIRNAVSQTPRTELAIALRRPCKLLDTDDIKLLYDQYEIVNSVLGTDAHDLLSPAVIWLSARILRDEDSEIAFQH